MVKKKKQQSGNAIWKFQNNRQSVGKLVDIFLTNFFSIFKHFLHGFFRAFSGRLAILQLVFEEGDYPWKDEKCAAEDEGGGVAFRFRVQEACVKVIIRDSNFVVFF